MVWFQGGNLRASYLYKLPVFYPCSSAIDILIGNSELGVCGLVDHV
jgi:hypothetical protein